MTHFYSALALTEQKQPGAITRISHFGDSPISGDLISGEARTLMQDKFGDSGHGFILVSKPWDFYYHENVLMEGKGWKVNSPVLPGGGGGDFGLGGASFTADSSSASSRDPNHFERRRVGGQPLRYLLSRSTPWRFLSRHGRSRSGAGSSPPRRRRKRRRWCRSP